MPPPQQGLGTRDFPVLQHLWLVMQGRTPEPEAQSANRLRAWHAPPPLPASPDRKSDACCGRRPSPRTSQVPPALAIRQPDAPVRHTGSPRCCTAQVSRLGRRRGQRRNEAAYSFGNILGQVGRPPSVSPRASMEGKLIRADAGDRVALDDGLPKAPRPPATPNRPSPGHRRH